MNVKYLCDGCKQLKDLINSIIIRKMHLAEDNHSDVDDNNDVANVDVEDCGIRTHTSNVCIGGVNLKNCKKALLDFNSKSEEYMNCVKLCIEERFADVLNPDVEGGFVKAALKLL